MGRILRAAAQRTELRLLRVDGGLKDNAIPVACTAQVVAAEPQAVLDAVREMEAALNNEYRATDPALWIGRRSAPAEQPMDERSTRRVLCMLACLPNGVQAMSADIHGLVQTSLNLGDPSHGGDLSAGLPSACAARWTPSGRC